MKVKTSLIQVNHRKEGQTKRNSGYSMRDVQTKRKFKLLSGKDVGEGRKLRSDKIRVKRVNLRWLSLF